MDLIIFTTFYLALYFYPCILLLLHFISFTASPSSLFLISFLQCFIILPFRSSSYSSICNNSSSFHSLIFMRELNYFNEMVFSFVVLTVKHNLRIQSLVFCYFLCFFPLPISILSKYFQKKNKKNKTKPTHKKRPSFQSGVNPAMPIKKKKKIEINGCNSQVCIYSNQIFTWILNIQSQPTNRLG